MSRLAERIRNTEPWCAALLRAPVTENWDDEQDKENASLREIRLRPYWSPGFVMDFKGILFSPPCDAFPNGNRGDAVVSFNFSDPAYCIVETTFKNEIHSRIHEFCDRNKIANGKGDRFGCRLTSIIRADGGYRVYGSTASVDYDSSIAMLIPRLGPDFASELASGVQIHLRVIWHQVWCAMRLMDCRNVSVEEIHSRDRKAKRRRRNNRSVDSYHVLIIEGAGRYWEARPGDSQTCPSVRHHVVRGNFATYTEEKKLFGKITGLVWRPMHARGDKKIGSIVKDYQLTRATNEI